MDDIADLRTTIFTWITDDPDPADRDELYRLLDRLPESAAELRDRFHEPHILEGPLRAGPNGLNTATVRAYTTALLQRLQLDGPVLLAHDGSAATARLAETAGRVVTGSGRKALIISDPVATPVLTHATRHTAAVCGIMFTASDVGGERARMTVIDGPDEATLPSTTAQIGPLTEIPVGPEPDVAPDDLRERYLESLVSLVDRFDPKIIPLVCDHPLLAEALEEAGFGPVTHTDSDKLDEQAESDGSRLILRLSPEGTTCSVSYHDDEQWRDLSATDMGILLADHWMRKGRRGTYIGDHGLIQALCETHGVEWRAVGDDGPAYRFTAGPDGREHCPAPDLVDHGDGIATALVLTEIAAGMAAQFRTPVERLDELAEEHGVFVSNRQPLPADNDADVYLRRLAKCERLLDENVRAVAADDDHVSLSSASFTVRLYNSPRPHFRAEVKESSQPGLAVSRERARASVEALSTEVNGLLGIAY
ncbi:hypothetical protein [Haloglycomyces albus]|uniref:hypothetical protein n=1 Tax=Haloglycomyces albus TaxID=526067 RepID=UPI00046C9A8E|nr:hypothetical protein [Haloglycomyces albus]